jgi:hypothetical protein
MASIASVARVNAASVLSPSPCDRGMRPLCASVTSAASSWWRTITPAMTPGCASQRSVEPSTSVSANVTMPEGTALSRADERRSTKSGALGGRRLGSGSRARRTIRSSRFARSGAMPSHTIGSPGLGGAPVSAKTVVAASPNMSLARSGAAVASSGAR